MGDSKSVTVKTAFLNNLRTESHPGSNKPASYVRAIELLEDILARKAPPEFQMPTIWAVQSPDVIQRLYEFVLDNQRMQADGIFAGEEPVSYWRDGFMSAALKSYCEFLVISNHADKLFTMVKESNASPETLSAQLQDEEVDAISAMLPLQAPASWEGKEVLRETKARVNQRFFRRFILEIYGHKCCLTEFGIPELLVASHIVPWADDEKNRLNPCNGLCLNALHDRAFDRGFISFDDDCRLLLSDRLSEHYNNEVVSANFAALAGKPIAKPEKFPPDPAFLARHRKVWGY